MSSHRMPPLCVVAGLALGFAACSPALDGETPAPDDTLTVDSDGDGSPDATDCDPDDPGVYPGAAEECNQIDDNCDGILPEEEVDSDGDGSAPCQGDCDDNDDTSAPGAEEVCDGRDNDCDGQIPEYDTLTSGDRSCASLASVAVATISGRIYEAVGRSVAGVGDVDGDGVPEVLVGAPFHDEGGAESWGGQAYVFRGADLAAGGEFTTSDAWVTIVGDHESAGAGLAVAAAGDLDGDGLADLALGAPFHDADDENLSVKDGRGAVYVFRGATVAAGGSFNTSDADFVRLGPDDGYLTGFEVAGAGDTNGDGRDELLVGSPGAGGWGETGAGVSWLLRFPELSPTEEVPLVPTSGVELEGEAFMDASGARVAAAGDVDGDGLDDILIGAPNCAPGWLNSLGAGKSYLLSGASVTAGSAFSLSSAEVVFRPPLDPTRTSSSSPAGLGDIDGDGRSDVAVPGGPEPIVGAVSSVFLASDLDGWGPRDLVEAHAHIREPGVIVTSPVDVVGVGDANGDGVPDVLAGTAGAPAPERYAGRVVLYSGVRVAAGGSLTPADAMAVWFGGSENEMAGYSVAGAGDINGDGLADILVGSPGGFHAGGPGRVYVVLGAP